MNANPFDARTIAYADAVMAAYDDTNVDRWSLGLSRVCPECGANTETMTSEQDEAHRMVDGWVVVGCEGYYLCDPALVGLDRGQWTDWRRDHCGDCQMPRGLHCNECNECPRTEGSCYCGAWHYSDPSEIVELSPTEEDEVAYWAARGMRRCEHGYLVRQPSDCPYFKGTAEPAQAATDEPTQALPVWTPKTPQERRHEGVAALVAETMGAPEGQRYARAYGALAGLVLSSVSGMDEWARDYVRQLDEAMRTGLTRNRIVKL